MYIYYTMNMVYYVYLTIFICVRSQNIVLMRSYKEQNNRLLHFNNQNKSFLIPLTTLTCNINN